MRVPDIAGKTLHQRIFSIKNFHFQLKKQFNKQSVKDFSGKTPNIFVGSYNYPRVNLGLLSTPNYDDHDNPLLWSKDNTPIAKIAKLRSELVNAASPAHVKLPSGKLAEKIRNIGREVAMSVKPADVEINLEKKPQFTMHFPRELTPHGPQGSLVSANLTSNTKIPRVVDRVVEDSDLKAGDALHTLRKAGLDEHQLTKLLSASTLGSRLERRLVPTRWSITAVDDVLGKKLHKGVVNLREHDFAAYFGGHLGNYFLILFLPQSWSFELFENYVGSRNDIQNKMYTDYESFRGRQTYAQNTAGGYYASRLATLEFLNHKRRSAGVLAIRFITDEYWAPLGVWVVREAMRKALRSKPLLFDSEVLLLKYASLMAKKRFNFDLSTICSSSKILHARKTQTSLKNFF